MRKLSDEYIVVDENNKPLGLAFNGHQLVEFECPVCFKKEMKRKSAKRCSKCAKKVKYEKK